MKDYMEYREEVCRFAKKMYEAGFVTGSAGNISLRVPEERDRYVITATSLPYEEMCPEQVPVVDGEGDLVLDIDYGPSVETPMHLAVFKARPDVNGIIHSHAIYSTILAVLRKPIPPIIEELLVYVGDEVKVAEYGSAGSDELARNAVKALAGNSAILLANHGNLCVGKSLLKAFNLCALVEKAARIYVEALKLGGLHYLPEEVVEAEKEMYKAMKDM
jgi:L-fuculose-phosphate aldolase